MLPENEGASGGTEPEDEISEAPAVAVTQRGDLWLIGQHRLLCGDCRDARVVALLFESRKANVVVTSPPYATQREYDPASGFRPVAPEEYIDWYQAVAENITAVLAPDGSYFLNIKEHAEDGQRHLYVKDLTIAHVRQWGWCFVDEFCWRKTDNGVPGGWGNRFKNAWEPIFHFTRSGGEIKFRSDAVSHPSDGAFDPSAPRRTKRSSASAMPTVFCATLRTTSICSARQSSSACSTSAQDLNKMQLTLIRKWGQRANYFIVAGDDDQTIYSFTGASPDAILDPDIPNNHKIILKRSYRVPRALHGLANRLIRQVTRRQEKPYLPRAEDGKVGRLETATYKRSAEKILPSLEKQLSDGKSIMVLASCSYAPPLAENQNPQETLGGAVGCKLMLRIFIEPAGSCGGTQVQREWKPRSDPQPASTWPGGRCRSRRLGIPDPRGRYSRLAPT